MAPCSGATDAIPAARAQNCARIPGTPTASSGSSASSPARKHPGAAPASHTALCSPAENCSSAGIAAAPVPVPLLRALPGCFASRSLGNLLFLYTPGPCWSLADLMAHFLIKSPISAVPVSQIVTRIGVFMFNVTTDRSSRCHQVLGNSSIIFSALTFPSKAGKDPDIFKFNEINVRRTSSADPKRPSPLPLKVGPRGTD